MAMAKLCAAMPTVAMRNGAPLGRACAARRDQKRTMRCRAAADPAQGRKRPAYEPGRIADPNYVRYVGTKRSCQLRAKAFNAKDRSRKNAW